MDYLRKGLQKAAKSVGLGSQAPSDPRLEAQRKKLDRLVTMIAVLRQNFVNYAKAMTAMTKASCIVAKDVSQFYSKSQSRQKSIGLFTDAHFTLDESSDQVFRDEFGREVLSMLDDWSSNVKTVRGSLKDLDQRAKFVKALEVKVQSYEQRQDRGRITAQEDDDFHAAKEDLRDAKASYKDAYENVDKLVSSLVDGRFSEFDKSFVRLMECQVEFFQHASNLTDSFKPNIENYRARFPRQASRPLPETPTRPRQNGTSPAPPASTPPSNNRKHVPKQASNENNAAAFKAVPQKPLPATPDKASKKRHLKEKAKTLSKPLPPQPKPRPKNARSATADVLDLDLLSDTVSPTNSSHSVNSHQDVAQPSPHRPSASQNSITSLFDDVEPVESNINVQITAPPSSNGANLIDDVFGDGPARGGDDLFNMFDLPTPSNTPGLPADNSTTNNNNVDKKSTLKPGGNSLFDQFDPCSANASPKDSPRNSKAGSPNRIIGSYTDHDEHEFSGLLGSRQDNEMKKQEERKEDMYKRMQQSQSQEVAEYEATRAPGQTFTEWQVARNQERARQRIQEEEQRKAQELRDREIADNTYSDRLNQWQYKNGVQRNIRHLLTTLDKVLWQPNNWKAPSMADLLDHGKVKKFYRKAMMLSHPDRHSGETDPNKKFVAERVFEAVNSAFTRFEKGEQ